MRSVVTWPSRWKQPFTQTGVPVPLETNTFLKLGIHSSKYSNRCAHAQSPPTLCNTLDCIPPGSSVLGIFQARIPEWVAISYSRGSSWPGDWTHLSCVSCTAGRFFIHQAIREAQDGASGKEHTRQCRRLKSWVQSMGGEDPLEKGMATHSSILSWRIP